MQSHAEDFWWPYLASYEAGPGAIRVNLGLKLQAPLIDHPNLVVTGVTYSTARSDGFPDQTDVERLNALSTKIVAAIQEMSPSVYVGTFTHNREQLHYVYVKDVSGIKESLSALYAKACEGCKTYTNIKSDPAWSAYKDFLYPNQATLKFYENEFKKIGFRAQ